MTLAIQEARVMPKTQALDFVWLELTNRCNLHCVHCYSDSSPYSDEHDLLMEDDYLRLIQEIRQLGSPNLQFIGGEPTLNRSLRKFIAKAREVGFSFVEVYTNLHQLSDTLLETFARHQVAVATSFYAADPEIHDAITTHKGSFKRTVANIQRVLDAGLQLRASVITMEQNKDCLAQTWQFLADMGVTTIDVDHVREMGRARDRGTCDMGQLCGRCAGSILAIGPDGKVSPCIMSKEWSVGSVLEHPLSEIAASPQLAKIRQDIAASVEKATNHNMTPPTFQSCGPSPNWGYQPQPDCGPSGSTPLSAYSPSALTGGGPNSSAPNACGPSGSAPVFQSACGPSGSIPQACGPSGSAPVSQSACGPSGSAPHACGPSGSAPYACGPSGSAPHACGPSGSAPYACGPSGSAPYACGPSGSAPMFQSACGPSGSAPHACGPSGSAPVPI